MGRAQSLHLKNPSRERRYSRRAGERGSRQGWRNESPRSPLELLVSVVLRCSVMRKVFTPSIVPSAVEQTVYLVLDDFGDAQVWRECSPDEADVESVIAGLVTGQYNDPVRIVAFNTDEHYCEDVSADIAREIQRRADLQYEDVSSSAVDFVERHARERQYR